MSATVLRRLLLVLGTALLVPTAAQAACAAAPARLAELTGQTLAAVDDASRLVAAGQPDEADARLAAVEAATHELEAAFDCVLGQVAPLENKCVIAVQALETRTGLIRARERDLEAALDTARADLARLRVDQSLNQAALAAKRAEAVDAQARLAEIRARNEELERWWWVPGYGQYLAIRTLADNDVGRYRTALDELGAAHGAQQALYAALRGYAAGAIQASNGAVCSARLHQSLAAARSDATAQLQRAKETRVFLSEAKSFLARARSLATSSGVRKVELARALIAFLAQEGPGAAVGLTGAGPITTMKASLEAFAELVASRPDFLTADAIMCDFDEATPEAGVGTPRDGALVKTAAAPTLWFIDGGRRRALPDMKTLGALGLSGAGFLLLTPAQLGALPEGAPIPMIDAGPDAIVRNAAGTHFLLQDGRRRLIPDAATFEGLDLRWDEAVPLSDAALAALPAGRPLPSLPAKPGPPVISEQMKLLAAAAGRGIGYRVSAAGAGLLVRDPTSGGTYWLQHGRRVWLPDVETFTAMGFEWSEVFNLPAETIEAIPDTCRQLPGT